MAIESVTIPLRGGAAVSGVLAVPEGFRAGEGTGVVLAHGAGNDMNHPLITSVAGALFEAGHVTLRFNFLYRERGLERTDSLEVLFHAWEGAYRFLYEHPRCRPRVLVAVGKSLGGRVAAQMVAAGLLPVDRLVFLGYPLHPPGKPERLRDAHLYGIAIPMLFFAGTRDDLCDLALLRAVLQRVRAAWVLDVVEGGDHSFHVPKAAGFSEDEIYRRILKRVLGWLGGKMEVGSRTQIESSKSGSET
jgi:predicted alpha/beta-hydrolase family hydrolase